MDVSLENKYLELLEKGNHEAFDVLFKYYYPKVKRFISGFVKDDEVASDLSQDIFLKVWINRETISKVSSFKNYLFRMCRNIVYDYFAQTAVCCDYDVDSNEKNILLSNETVEAEETIYAEELSLLIDIIVEKMPPQRKRIFIMSRREGLSNDEIATKLLISRRTVENHITQALYEIRKITGSLLFLSAVLGDLLLFP